MYMNKKTVLVVMPIYNAEKTLSGAIESILRQSYTNIQLVLVNDASTDRSLEIALSYKKDKRVTVLNNKHNMGAYYCRNAGLYYFKDFAWGFFTTHDADDISYPDRIGGMVQFFNSSIVTGVQDIFKRKDIYTMRKISQTLTVAHAMYSRFIFEKVGYFETVRFGADWEHWARVTVFNRINSLTTRSRNTLGGESFVGKDNLTVKIPLGSKERANYIIKSRELHDRMAKKNNFYVPFVLDKKVTIEL